VYQVLVVPFTLPSQELEHCYPWDDKTTAARPLRFLTFHGFTHFTTPSRPHDTLSGRLVILYCTLTCFTSAPEPAGAVAPVPATATAAQEPVVPTTTEPKPTEAKATEAPAQEPVPEFSTTKPAPGMSATSGPLGDEPDFGVPESAASAPAPAAAPASAIETAPAAEKKE
jgi:hypothetical protein